MLVTFPEQDMASQGVINAQTLASRSAVQVARRSAHLFVLTLHQCVSAPRPDRTHFACAEDLPAVQLTASTQQALQQPHRV